AAFLKEPFWAEVSRFSLALPKPRVTAEYRSRSGVRLPTTVQVDASMTVTGTRFPSSSNTWVIPIFLPIKPFKTRLLAREAGLHNSLPGGVKAGGTPAARRPAGRHWRGGW